MPGNFGQFAPYLQEPLILVGFFLFLAFLFLRTLLLRGIIPPLPPGRGFEILRTILLYGFILGVLLVILGFGLRFRALHEQERAHQAEEELKRQDAAARERQADNDRRERAERERRQREDREKLQQNTLGLLRGEMDGNLRTANQLRLNSISILGVFQTLVSTTRMKEIKILPVLFPSANLDNKSTPVELADKAFESLAQTGLDKDQAESAKFSAVATAITGTVDRTLSTVRSLGDPDGRRYPIRSEAWDKNQDIMRELPSLDVSGIQSSYVALRALRTNYDVVVSRTIEYMEVLREFLTPGDHVMNRQRLARVLAAERFAMQLLTTYGAAAVRDVATLSALSHHVQPIPPSPAASS